MRLQQPVRVVASAPAALYKESCCPAARQSFRVSSTPSPRGRKRGVVCVCPGTEPAAQRDRAHPPFTPTAGVLHGGAADT